MESVARATVALAVPAAVRAREISQAVVSVRVILVGSRHQTERLRAPAAVVAVPEDRVRKAWEQAEPAAPTAVAAAVGGTVGPADKASSS